MIAAAVQTLDVACDMAMGLPFSRAAGRVTASPFRVSTTRHAAIKATHGPPSNYRFLAARNARELPPIVGVERRTALEKTRPRPAAHPHRLKR